MQAHFGGNGSSSSISTSSTGSGSNGISAGSHSNGSSSGSNGGGSDGGSNGAVRGQRRQQRHAPVPDDYGEELGRHSYRMLLCYDGTAYSGWQLQAQAPTIQGAVETALSMALREGRKTLGVCAAGRTDAGVHAEGQVVQFMTNATAVDPARLPHKLNSLLPADIRVRAMHQTAPDFHVTVSALHKVRGARGRGLGWGCAVSGGVLRSRPRSPPRAAHPG